MHKEVLDVGGNLGKNNRLHVEVLVVGLISAKSKRLHFY